MKFKKEHGIIAVLLVIIAFITFGNYLSLGTQAYVTVTADTPVEINYASIILVNPTDCCTPTIQVITPWNSTEITKITMGQTITFINEDNPTEKYIIKSVGQGIQYAVPGSGYYVDTVKSVKLETGYIEGEPIPTPTPTLTATPTPIPTPDTDIPVEDILSKYLLCGGVFIGVVLIIVFKKYKK